MITTFFTAVFTSTYWLGTWLNTATLIACAALGAAIALQSGNLNLGGESQIYLGGFVTALWLNHFLPATQASSLIIIVVFLSALLVALICGILVTLLAALLKRWHGINEMITTFLISATLIPILDYAVSGPFRDTTQNLLATPEIADFFKLTHLLSISDLNTSFIFVILLAFLLFFVLYKTQKGNRLQICGLAPEFAFASGYKVDMASCIGLSTSGALHSLTGFIAIVGTYYSCYKGFYSGIGWNALSVALIAHSNPLAIFPVTLLLSFIYTSSDAVMLTSGASFDFESILQGLILLFVSIQIIKRQKYE
jgi:simple sugar transport system permease protein